MRKVSFGLAIGFVLVACGGGGEEPPKTPEAPPVATAPAPTTTTAEAPKEEPKKKSFAEMRMDTMKSLGEAINAHDAKKVAALYTENAKQMVAGAPDMTGREAIQGGWQKLFDAFSNFKSAPNRVFVKDDVVVVEWAFNGTHTGDLWGIKATEKPVGANGMDVIWLDKDSGLIKEHHVYYDGATVLSQIGLSKQKARPIPTLATTMPAPIEAKGTPEEQKNVDAYKAMAAAMDNHKEADFLANIADNVEYDDYTMPQTMKGKADAKKFFKEMTTAFPDMKTTVNNAWGFGDYVVGEATGTGTNKGPMMGMPATKKTVTMKMGEVQQFKDGKLVHGWGYSNAADMMQQMGLMPAPGAAKPGDKGATPAKPADKATPAKPGEKPATPAKPADKATPAKPADKK